MKSLWEGHINVNLNIATTKTTMKLPLSEETAIIDRTCIAYANRMYYMLVESSTDVFGGNENSVDAREWRRTETNTASLAAYFDVSGNQVPVNCCLRIFV